MGKGRRKTYVRNPPTDVSIGISRLAREETVCGACWVPLRGRHTAWCDNSCYWDFQTRYGTVQDWGVLRWLIIERDGHRCTNCDTPRSHFDHSAGKIVGAVLEVDHIVEIQDGGQEFDPANLRTLCHRCHAAKTAARRRGHDPEAALRFIRTPQPTLEAVA
jgi:5-methylcytosine-specific restriction endonuclease McrA